MTDTMNLAPYLDAALEIATLAADLMLKTTDEAHARRKADGTLVTDLDHAIDQLITAELRTRFPDHRLLSEESSTTYDPTAPFTWIIDPLDGTTNYARGLPIWGVSLALVQDGSPVVGVLTFPHMRETFAAMRGQGATRNQHPIAVSDVPAPDDEHFIMYCTRTPRRYTVTTPLKLRILGSAAYHIAKVADGTALAVIEATPKVWDLAAALLILEEAGVVYAPRDTQPKQFPLQTTHRAYARRTMPLLGGGCLVIFFLVGGGIGVGG